MTDTDTTTSAPTIEHADLPPYVGDLGEEARGRAIAAIVSSSLLVTHIPFRAPGSLLGPSKVAPSTSPGEVATAVVDLAEWITTGLHPLAEWMAQPEELEEATTA